MINHLVLQGRLVRDPELKTTNSNIPFCSFTVAWSDKRGENQTSLFLPVIAWRGTAEFVAKYFTKGQEIAVEGDLKQRIWTDSNGNKRSAIEMHADKIHFCGSKQQADGDEKQDFVPIPDDEDVPF